MSICRRQGRDTLHEIGWSEDVCLLLLERGADPGAQDRRWPTRLTTLPHTKETCFRSAAPEVPNVDSTRMTAKARPITDSGKRDTTMWRNYAGAWRREALALGGARPHRTPE